MQHTRADVRYQGKLAGHTKWNASTGSMMQADAIELI